MVAYNESVAVASGGLTELINYMCGNWSRIQ